MKFRVIDRWRERPLSARDRENQRLLDRIRALHAQSDGTFGAGPIWEDLCEEGEHCSLNGLQGIPCEKKLRSKPSGTRPADIENHLTRDFKADEPNTKWVTDITYVRIVGGQWLYLCVVVDLYSGIVVGWSMSRCQNRQLVLQAVLRALWQRESKQPVILHSDHGCQFTSDEYQRFLKGHNLTCSMSRVGNCAEREACPWGTTRPVKASSAC